MFRESQSPTFQFQAVSGLLACRQHVVTFLHWVGGLSFHRTTRRYASDCHLRPFRRNQESCDSVLIINCLSLLFGTQRRSNKKQGTWRALYLGNAPRGPARFQSPLLFATSQSSGGQGWDKKRDKVLGREVNHKPCRGTQFQGELISVADAKWKAELIT